MKSVNVSAHPFWVPIVAQDLRRTPSNYSLKLLIVMLILISFGVAHRRTLKGLGRVCGIGGVELQGQPKAARAWECANVALAIEGGETARNQTESSRLIF